MFQLRGGMSAREDVGDLLHLQGTLEGGGVVELAAEEKHPGRVDVLLGDGADVIGLLEDALDLAGQIADLAEEA